MPRDIVYNCHCYLCTCRGYHVHWTTSNVVGSFVKTTCSVYSVFTLYFSPQATWLETFLVNDEYLFIRVWYNSYIFNMMLIVINTIKAIRVFIPYNPRIWTGIIYWTKLLRLSPNLTMLVIRPTLIQGTNINIMVGNKIFFYLFAFITERSWTVVTNSIFLIPTALQSNAVNLWYFKFKYLPIMIHRPLINQWSTTSGCHTFNPID